jgi:hypothetical protein
MVLILFPFHLFLIDLMILVGGILLFGVGFYVYKKKQLIEDTPTSKIRSLAMGLVELFGQVIPIPERLFKSPFTEKDCVYYQFTVEEYVSSGKSSHWETIKKGEKRILFYLKDDTGMVLVDPTGASIEATRDFDCESGHGRDPPESVVRFLTANNIAYEGFFGANKTMRYRENIIVPNQNLYIMGTADENPFANDPGANQGLPYTIIRKGAQEKMFFISDKKERDILREFNMKIVGAIVLGLLLFILGLLMMYFEGII